MIGKVFGAKARFCNEGCWDCFKSDKECGLIYPPWEGPEPGTVIDVYDASLQYEICAYCNEDLSDDPKKDDPIPRTKSNTKRQPCPQCEILYVNGVRCHESGCPEGP